MPPPSQPPKASSIVAQLNERFKHGRPSDALDEAGVLVHTFDAVDAVDMGRLDVWTPCPADLWCGHFQRFSVSLINQRLPHFFNENKQGGFVLANAPLSPPSSKLRCAFAFDAGGMVGHGGCPGTVCGDPSDAFGASTSYCYWEGSQLKHMLDAHELRAKEEAGYGEAKGGSNYNEIVIGADVWLSALPHLIEAIFFPAHVDAEAGAEARARQVHAAFLAEFGGRVPWVPLLRYDREQIDSPFALA